MYKIKKGAKTNRRSKIKRKTKTNKLKRNSNVT